MPNHPLDSARERLKRADENIRSLNTEIAAFLAPIPVVSFDAIGEEPIFTEEHRKRIEELKDFIINGTVSPRFSVLAGEVIHHLRSAFDHVAWQLSSVEFRAKFPHQIEFPVFREPDLCSLTTNKMCRYCRKVAGIVSPTALAKIDSLQPYHTVKARRHPLWLIHDMDRTDKHRELVLAVYIMSLNLLADTRIQAVGQQLPWELKPRNIRFVSPPEVNMKGKMSAQITLREFSGRDDQPIIPTLENLLAFSSNAIDSFAEEFD